MKLEEFCRIAGVGYAIEDIATPEDTPIELLNQKHFQMVIWREGALGEVRTTVGIGGLRGAFDASEAFLQIKEFVGDVHKGRWDRMRFLRESGLKDALALAGSVERLMGEWFETYLGELTYDRSKH